MMGALCPRCRGQVELHAGRPRITASGAIEIWCAGCVGKAPIVEATPPVSSPTTRSTAVALSRSRARGRGRRLVLGPIALTALGALLLGRWGSPGARAADVTLPAPFVEPNGDDDVAPSQIAISHEINPPLMPRRIGLAPPEQWPVANVGGEPLDHVYPSLAGWIHPVVDSPEPTPAQTTRWFGAARVGIDVAARPECGEGHCGIDLDGPRGRPVVAVAGGVVVRVEHSELGRDKRSGRYVRIQHDDGALTAYMHLDDIAEGLEVGDRVVAGEQIGTLGATAVYKAAPHLHFSLALPLHFGVQGDSNDNYYIDPMPFLARAKVIKAPDRRRSQKAQW
jgi:murein DD-endopeptidase MepM/ murein hydrolase activator NlpD